MPGSQDDGDDDDDDDNNDNNNTLNFAFLAHVQNTLHAQLN